jgi:hypothetical protein
LCADDGDFGGVGGFNLYLVLIYPVIGNVLGISKDPKKTKTHA